MNNRNSRYKIYQRYKLIKTNLMNVKLLGPILVKILTAIKNLSVKIYNFYITKLKYAFPKSLKHISNKAENNKISIDPNEINYYSHYDHENEKESRRVAGGKWDKLDKKILDKSISFEESNQKDYPIQNIATNIFGEIKIDIGRFGDLLLVDGGPHLLLAKQKDVLEITAEVLTRHTKWARFRKRYETLVTRVGAKSYQPAVHPDLTYIPAEQSCKERLNLIKANLSGKTGKLLDLGANIGYFTINFENEGFDCTAVEYFPNYIYGLVGQRRALNKKFSIIKGSFLDSKDITNQSYDVVLALNVFSHLIVQKETFEKLSQFLEKLRCKAMFFEPYAPDDPQMKNSFIKMTQDEFAEFVRQKLGLENCEIIGRASDGRPLYKIS